MFIKMWSLKSVGVNDIIVQINVLHIFYYNHSINYSNFKR